MSKKRKLKIPRTIIDGIVHRPCTRCGDLFPEDAETRCKKCRAELRLAKRKKENLKLYGTEHHPQRKNTRNVERKQIDGVDWLKCVCGDWLPKSETIGAKCGDCRREWANEYYRKYYAANKNRALRTDSEEEKIKSEEKLRELELNGDLPIVGGVFGGVPVEIQNAMESGDFKAFMSFVPEIRDYKIETS